MPAVFASGSGPDYTLEIQGNSVPNVYGGWRTRIAGLSGGAYYRFRGRAVALDIASLRQSITILLRWRGAFGDEVAPDYIWPYMPQADDSLVYDRTLQAPPGTTAVDVELVLQWAPAGRVRFDDLSFTPAAAPAARRVKTAAIFYRPSGTRSGLESVQRAAQFGESVAAAQRPDVMVFGEMLNVIGAPGTYDAKAETIPGPSTDVMANLARGYGVNVVFGLLERDGRFLYNSAVMLDRDGNIGGKYRKMQLPLSEAAAGISPGNAVPVFDADFGRVALLICQDMAFPEPAREAAIQGAEMLLVPIWGGKELSIQARAVEQSMYVVSSGYDYASDIVDPLGRVLDVVDSLSEPGAAVATIDLRQRFREPWSGVWRDVSNKERRVTAYTSVETPPPGGGDPPPPPPDAVPPVVTITSPSSGATVSGNVTINANASDNFGIVTVQFTVDGVPIGAEDTDAPYSVTWDSRSASNGPHSVGATARDAAGNIAASSVTVTTANPTSPPPGSTPFSGTALPIPGRIETEHFDNGGQNIAYFDTTAGNRGGVYRATDVDLEATADAGGGYNVARIRPAEWLNYSVNVGTGGTYTLRARVASLGAGGRFHVESGGADLTGPITVPDTGGWQTWTTVTTPITLTAGGQVLRLVIDAESAAGVGNINWLEIVPASTGSTPFSGTPVVLPGRIEAEAFDNGGANVAYRDVTSGNSGGDFRTTDVDIEESTDVGGGYNLAWMRAGEWLNYTVNVPTAGNYVLRVRVAANGAGGQFHIESQGIDRTGAMTVPNTGGWQTWTTISRTVTLPAGVQVLRFVVDTVSPAGVFGNVNWLEVASP